MKEGINKAERYLEAAAKEIADFAFNLIKIDDMDNTAQRGLLAAIALTRAVEVAIWRNTDRKAL